MKLSVTTALMVVFLLDWWRISVFQRNEFSNNIAAVRLWYYDVSPILRRNVSAYIIGILLSTISYLKNYITIFNIDQNYSIKFVLKCVCVNLKQYTVRFYLKIHIYASITTSRLQFAFLLKTIAWWLKYQTLTQNWMTIKPYNFFCFAQHLPILFN